MPLFSDRGWEGCRFAMTCKSGNLPRTNWSRHASHQGGWCWTERFILTAFLVHILSSFFAREPRLMEAQFLAHAYVPYMSAQHGLTHSIRWRRQSVIESYPR